MVCKIIIIYVKTDIHLGMIAGSICPKCRANLARYGISEKAIYSTERMLG